MGVLARFSENPNYRACKAVLRVLVYLRGTSEKGIHYTGTDLCVYAYSDADWAGDLDSRKSTTGYVAVEVADEDRGFNDGSRIYGCFLGLSKS